MGARCTPGAHRSSPARQVADPPEAWLQRYPADMDEASSTSAAPGTAVARARTWLTVPELATFLRALLADGEQEDALRFMLDGLNKIDEVLGAERPDQVARSAHGTALDTDLAEFLSPPESLGEDRWDTLLACSTAHVVRSRGLAPPAWTTKPSLPQWWWPAGEKRRRAMTMQHTPTDFRRVGIWFSDRNFLTA